MIGFIHFLFFFFLNIKSKNSYEKNNNLYYVVKNYIFNSFFKKPLYIL